MLIFCLSSVLLYLVLRNTPPLFFCKRKRQMAFFMAKNRSTKCDPHHFLCFASFSFSESETQTKKARNACDSFGCFIYQTKASTFRLLVLADGIWLVITVLLCVLCMHVFVCVYILLTRLKSLYHTY